MSPVLEVALNGSRSPREHPAVPRAPQELAHEARAAVDAGAQILHLHVYEQGVETLAAAPTSDVLLAVRALCPGVPISLSTSAAIEPDPRRRFEAIAGWTELPELVSANQGEDGIVRLCEHLLGRGVGVEAGLLSVDDARAFVSSGLSDRCERVLVEPLDAEPEAAVVHAAAIEGVLDGARVSLEQVHHGDGVASWAVNARALVRGHGIRTGLEDTTVIPDGRSASDNTELVTIAMTLIGQGGD